MLDLTVVNWWAVLVASMLSFVLGGAWYSAFSKPWMAMTGISEETMSGEQSHALLYVGAFLTYLIAVAVMALLANATGVQGIVQGLLLGLLAGVGLVATVSFNNYMFSGRPFKLYLIDIGYPVIALAVAGVIIGVWQ